MITLLWPTARPAMFKTTVKEWKLTASNWKDVKLIIGVDTVAQAMELSEFPNVKISNSERRGVTWTAYTLTYNLKVADDDIVILASDDFYPPDKWDDIVKEQLKGETAVLLVHDGYQPRNAKVGTIPIMTGSALKKLNNIIYPPDYYHLWSDAEFYFNANDLNLIKDIRKTHESILFEHRHYAAGKRKRDNIDTALSEFEKIDTALYKKRQGLPVSERIKSPQIEIVLSILIPTMTKREKLLSKLLENLYQQQNQSIEILTLCGNKASIGKKRNDLIFQSAGKYIAFVDDDDTIHPYYANIILEAIKSGKASNENRLVDVIGITGIYTDERTLNQEPKKFIHSIKYGAWFEEKGIYYRPPNHLNPIRKELAQKAKFKLINMGEDKDYSIRIKKELVSEVFINTPIYHYRDHFGFNIKKQEETYE